MDKDSDLLKCSVCEESYNNKKHCPRILNCSHTFCTVCIGQLISNGKRYCPVCRQSFNAWSKENIAVNRALLDIIDVITKKMDSPSSLRQSKGSSFEGWQKSFSKDLKEGSFAICSKEKAFTKDAMKRKRELKESFKEKSDKIDDKLIPTLSETSRKFKTYIKKIDEDHQFLETRYGTLTKEEEELSRIESNVKASKSFASVDQYVATTGKIDKRLETLTTELKNFASKDESEHSKMLKELKDAERKLAVMEDTLGNENKLKAESRSFSSVNLQRFPIGPSTCNPLLSLNTHRVGTLKDLGCRKRSIEKNKGINNYQDIFSRHGTDATTAADHDDNDNDDDYDE